MAGLTVRHTPTRRGTSQFPLGAVELRGPQGGPAPDRVLGDFAPCRGVALPQAGEISAARREHRLPQRGTVRAYPVVRTPLIRVEQDEVRLGAQKRGTQPAYQLDRGAGLPRIGASQ